ncbi:MAG TPA: hypothetical protein VHJ78_10970, partial [Actinomycetota bacterium]|nr:hypothetical protein [Actinomycetota bacterium]
LHNVFFWSPLYTAYYGTILKVTGDPVSATLVHRLILAFGLTALVLALARRLLPAAAAWLVAAWWAVLPVNFDTLYEVHLFGAIPALVAALAVCRWPGHAGRAAALAVLGTSAVLVRNEYGFAALLFALVCLWSLVREVGRLRSLRAGVPLLRPYVAAGLAATLAIGFFYSRSTVKFPILADIFNQRRTLNYCQAFAFNYSQRHPEWPGDPFTGCGGLMVQVFGVEPGTAGESIGFVEAYRRNPDEVRRYLEWNVKLIPIGIQLALFNAASGNASPDYVEVPLGRTAPWILTIACLMAILGGLWAVQQQPEVWKRWRDRRAWPLAVLACCCVGVLLVMVQQRPRPSYMFPLTFTVMAAIVLCAWALLRRLRAAGVLAAGLPLFFVALLVFAPSPYAGKQTPLADIYRRLEPLSTDIAAGAAAVPAYQTELCHYLAIPGCRMLGYWTTLRPLAQLSGSFAGALSGSDVSVLYADRPMLNDPVTADFLRNPGGWSRVGGKEGCWAAFRRTPPGSGPYPASLEPES